MAKTTILTSIHGHKIGLNHDGKLVVPGGYLIQGTADQRAEFDNEGFLTAVPPVFLQAYDTTNQIPADTNETLVALNTIVSAQGITYNAGVITIPRKGRYIIVAVGQVSKTSGSSQRTLDMWLKRNGVSVIGSTARVAITNLDSSTVTVNLADEFVAGETISIYQEVDNITGGIGLYTLTGDTAPDAPSIVLSIFRN